LANGYDDAESAYTPAWQASITGVSAEQAERIGREFAQNAEDSKGRSMILMGAGQSLVPFRHHLSHVLGHDDDHRLSGRQWRRLSPLCRPGKGSSADRVYPVGEGLGLVAAASQHGADRLLVSAHRPIPLRPVRRGYPQDELIVALSVTARTAATWLIHGARPLPGTVSMRLLRSNDGTQVINHMHWENEKAFKQATANNPAIVDARQRV
jgi:hypothetical protein